MTNMIVPPGGFAGFSQMTRASQTALFPGGSKNSGKRRRRRSRKASASRRSPKRSKRTPKFGTPAFRKKFLGKRKRKAKK